MPGSYYRIGMILRHYHETVGSPDFLQCKPDRFKETVLGFQRLNFRDEQTAYAENLQPEYGYALICSLLHNPTREMVAELGLNYL